MKPIARLALLAAVACAPANAQFFPPIDIEFGAFPVKAKLRCWYRSPQPGNPLATAYLNAEGFQLDGYWADLSPSLTSNLFYTKQAPDEMRQACERTLANHGVTGVPVQWNAAATDLSYNHQVWHESRLSPDAPVDRIVAFGDSLSDTGNIYNDLQWKFPVAHSWFLGRFSNGPVWTEYFAQMAGKPLNNWAIGGSETRDSNVFINGLDTQIASFRKYMSLARGYEPSRTVFTVLAGANDFMNDRRPEIRTVTDASDRLEAALEELVGLGASKIVLVNLPDISRTPAFRDDAQEALVIRAKVRLYNDSLIHIAKRIRNVKGVDIRLVDLSSLFDRLLANPGEFGIADTTHSCLDMPHDRKTDYLFGPAMTSDCDPQRYVFWDRVHPTTRVHRMIAETVFSTVAEAWKLGQR
ncbi:SGNH/GDSL hydrolase family protein [Luteibacter aegosomatis]|uniref:SGNH/GDSL hydrolase family protein n=1 Tax=Luteibacter aegosomatis TaxID=2911537 RepID=UPI001FF8BE31|nr:SGNH/GDSL hydrolase family protein [Luteibacter aegosomatis]UPG85441.1 SGNH/GDSL hydrolase family protein [Luteibacter aegosomatis]